MLSYSKLFLSSINIAYLEFDYYQELIEDFLNNEKKRIEKEFKKIESDVESDSDYIDFMYDGLIEEHTVIAKNFPNNFRASFFIQIISFIEYELKKICEYHYTKYGAEFSFNDLRGNDDLENAKIYLAKCANVKFGKLDPEWSYIRNAKEIRNVIVHHRGEIVLKSGKRSEIIEKFITQNNSFKFRFKKTYENGEAINTDEATIIIHDKKATDELLNKTKLFFTNLLDKELIL